MVKSVTYIRIMVINSNYISIYVLLHAYIYILYICIYICVCVCMHMKYPKIHMFQMLMNA